MEEPSSHENIENKSGKEHVVEYIRQKCWNNLNHEWEYEVVWSGGDLTWETRYECSSGLNFG